MKKISPFVLALVLLAVIFAFTPFYSVSYIAIIALATTVLGFSKTFSTLFGRSILATLLLLAVVMFVGFVTWLIKLPLHPIFVVAVFAALLALLARFKQEDVSTHQIIDRGDVLSLGLALVAPAVVIFSYYLPKPSDAALYQLGTSGWDNASHIQILESTSLTHSYIYGKFEDVKDKIISPSNAYPQAWHLATSHVANGFSVNLFDATKQFATISNYFMILLVWYIVAAYSVSRLSWTVLTSITSAYKKRPAASIITFIAASLLMQIVTVWGSLALGFANYLGLMAYLAVMYAMIIDKPPHKSAPASYLTAILTGGAGVLCWFLPIPAIAFSILLAFGITFKYRLSDILTNLKHHMLPFIITIGILALIATQIGVFIAFTNISGDEQLNAVGGTFPVSVAMIALMLAITGYSLYKNKAAYFEKYLKIVTPMTLFIGALYLYQLLTSTEPTYYFHKIAGLLAIATTIFFVPVVTTFVATFKTTSSIATPSLVGLSIISIFIVGTGQSTNILGTLLQRNSRISFSTAEAVADYLNTANTQKEKLFILTDRSKESGPKRSENVNGELGNKVSHNPYTCVNYIINLKNGRTLQQRLHNLGECADELKKTGQSIRVIANDKTADNIKELNRDNIHLVVVK